MTAHELKRRCSVANDKAVRQGLHARGAASPAVFAALCVGVLACGGETSALTITAETDPNVLAGLVSGPGVTVTSATLVTSTGEPVIQTGRFSGGASIGLDIDQGIILTTGDVLDVANPNTTGDVGLGDTPEANGGPSGVPDLSVPVGASNVVNDPDLDSLASGLTFDEVVLTIDFDLSAPGDVEVFYQFGSEEYLDYVGSQYNDSFGFFIDGVNVALTPGTSAPVTINTINGTTNSTFFTNNVPNTEGYPVNPTLLGGIRYDGLTRGLSGVRAGLAAGPHQIKFAIADVGDGAWDAGVLIGSFGVVPEPTAGALAALAGVPLASRRRRD